METWTLMDKVDSDGEVDSSEEEDVVGEGESIDREVVHQELLHLDTLVSILFHNYHLHLPEAAPAFQKWSGHCN